jgi:PhnB protein
MKLNAHLLFPGTCDEAFRFYEQCLGGTLLSLVRYGESPMAKEVSEDWQHRVLHATLLVGDNILMGADCPPERCKERAGFFVVIGVDDEGEAERIFQALSHEGQVQMPLQSTFWALRFGIVTDRFGTPWEINCERPPEQ